MDKKSKYCIYNSILFGVILNLVLPFILKPFATADEINPPNGAKNLSYKGQFMHMMIHHQQVPLISSLIIALIVGLSIFLGYIIKPLDRIFK